MARTQTVNLTESRRSINSCYYNVNDPVLLFFVSFPRERFYFYSYSGVVSISPISFFFIREITLGRLHGFEIQFLAIPLKCHYFPYCIICCGTYAAFFFPLFRLSETGGSIIFLFMENGIVSLESIVNGAISISHAVLFLCKRYNIKLIEIINNAAYR